MKLACSSGGRAIRFGQMAANVFGACRRIPSMVLSAHSVALLNIGKLYLSIGFQHCSVLHAEMSECGRLPLSRALPRSRTNHSDRAAAGAARITINPEDIMQSELNAELATLDRMTVNELR